MRHILTLFILILSSCSMNNNSDIDNIKKVLYTQQECWNNGDIDGFMKGYWNSEKLIFTTDKDITTYGWRNTLNKYKSSYPTREIMGELKFEIYDVQLTSNKTAIVNGKWEIIKINDLSQLTDIIKEESIVFSIMLHDNNDSVSKETLLNQRAEFENYLDSSGYFLDVKFIDKEDALKEILVVDGDSSLYSQVKEINLLPNSYDVHVKAKFVSSDGLKKIKGFIEDYKKSGVVKEIFYQEKIAEKIDSINPQGEFWLDLKKFENNWLIVKDSTTSLY